MSEVKEKVKSLLSGMGVEVTSFDDDQSLFDHGVDSLRLMELIAELEDSFDIEFPFDDLDNDSLSTINKIHSVVSKLREIC